MKKALFLFLIISNIGFAQYIKRDKALEDINKFIQLLKKQSSYFQMSTFDFQNKFKVLKREIAATDSVPIYRLAIEFEKLIAETLDRHASVRMEDFEKDDYPLLNLHFPFAVAPLKGKAVALIQDKKKNTYNYYHKKYPYIKSINGLEVSEFIERYAYSRKLSPSASRLTYGLKDIRNIGALFFKQNELYHKTVKIILANGEKEKTLTLPLVKEKHRWHDAVDKMDNLLMKLPFDEAHDYFKLDRWIGQIGYIRIPKMISYDSYTDFENYLHTTLAEFKEAKALIIDIRNNGGGTRDILNTFSKYIVQPEQSPWVANVAQVRSDQRLNEDIESMSGRYLYNFRSDHLTDKDRKAIKKFTKGFKPELAYDTEKFSEPFYMVLNSGKTPLEIPVYILVNEKCFSAATVFTTAFKGLPNVTIVGETTNGASGRSAGFYLNNSKIRIKLSTMLSFQRNGKTLDGNGTVPDIIIKRGEAQVFGLKDMQLEQLTRIINKKQAKKF